MPGKSLRSILIGLIVGGLLLTLMSLLRQWQLAPIIQSDTADDSSVSYNVAVHRTTPVVVNVYNRVLNNTNHNQLMLGSGVIMSQRGYILTDKHVTNNADQIIVTLQDGHAFEALLIGSDILTDLAVLKINATGGLSVIPINPKCTPYIGDVILAIGNPYNLRQTITRGTINATGHISLNPTGRQSFLQTDTSINHDNSGETLVNPLSELMGVNTLSFDKNNDDEMPEGIGLAIPFRLATKIMGKLIRSGRAIRDHIGISGREIVPLYAQGGGIDQVQGVVVNNMAPDGPVAQVRIHANNVIISVNDKPTVSALETTDRVVEIRLGSEIPVVIMHDDKKITLHIAVQEYPATNQTAPHLGNPVNR